MLKDDLYIVQKISEADNVVDAIVELNADNNIFHGHFPGQPVLPGACMMQMIIELMEVYLNKKLQLKKADDIRFSAMVDPNENKILHFQIQCKTVDVNAININAKILKQDETVCCKVKASLQLMP